MPYRKLKEIIFKEARYVPILLSLFVIPIFFHPEFIYPFTQGKEILFKTMMISTLLLTTIILSSKNTLRFKNILKSPLFLILSVQICIFAITDIFSDNPIVTLYGTYGRGFGLIIELFIFFFLTYCAQFLSEKNIKRLTKIAFYAGSLVAFYGLLQKAGMDPFFGNYDINIFAGRIFSFSGNPSYLGQLMALDFIVGIYLITNESNRSKKLLYVLWSLLIISAVILSGTRTALVGLVFAGIIFALKNRKIISIAIVMLTILSIFALPNSRFSFSNIALRSLNSRIEIWKGTIDLIKKKPFLGYGGETFYIYFPEIVTKTFFTLEENVNTTADRVHNEFLETFFSHGIFAAILYLILFAFLLGKFFKTNNRNIELFSLIFVANTIQNQFAFPDISINILIAFCFGSIIALEIAGEGVFNIKFSKLTSVLVIILTTIVCVSLFIGTVVRPYASQLDYAESKRNYATNYVVAVDKHKEAISHAPYYSDLWYELMMIDTSSMKEALSNLEVIEGKSGNVLAWTGNFYSKTNPQKASEFYALALAKNPYNPNWIRAFADMLYEQGDYQDALLMYYQYLEAMPDFWKWQDDINSHTLIEKNSYNTFLKTTPYFWGVIQKINNIINRD